MKAQLAAEVQKQGEAERDRQLGKLRGEAKVMLPYVMTRLRSSPQVSTRLSGPRTE